MFWIGISGPIASGKSTLAKALCEYLQELDVQVSIIPLARAVRDVAALEVYDENKRTRALFDLFNSWGYNSSIATSAVNATNSAFKTYPSVVGQKNRRLLQTIGIEVGRMILGEDVWIKRMLNAGKDFDIVISDDLRFDNEASVADCHVGIDVTVDESFYRNNLQQISANNKEYGFSDHISERSLTKKPDILVPVGFSENHIADVVRHVNLKRVLAPFD